MIRPPTPAARLLTVLLALAWAGATPAGEGGDTASAGGRLMWDLADELDLLGDLWVDLPFETGDGGAVFLALDTRTSISRASSDFTFLVRDLDYGIDLGWRARPGWAGGRRVALFAGQRGKERVDADGQPYVRFVGAGVESRRFRDPAARWAWRGAAGPVVEEREVAADLVVRGEARRLLGAGGEGGAASPVAFFDVNLDGLLEGGSFRGDVRGGPGFSVPMRGGRRIDLFVHYQRSRSPLGIGHSGFLAGFAYTELLEDFSPGRSAAEIDGSLASGAGDTGRLFGRLALRFVSPHVSERLRVAFSIDVNVLTARDTGELFYLYDLGLERSLGESRAGIYFYHRSNHQLAEPNDTITSINVLETGLETPGWRRPGRRTRAGRLGRLDGFARAGVLLDGSFGEDRRWHVRGGARWTLPGPALAPYLRLDAEAGDVDGRLYAIGCAPAPRLDVQLEYRIDEQLFGRDRTAILLSARYGFGSPFPWARAR